MVMAGAEDAPYRQAGVQNPIGVGHPPPPPGSPAAPFLRKPPHLTGFLFGPWLDLPMEAAGLGPLSSAASTSGLRLSSSSLSRSSWSSGPEAGAVGHLYSPWVPQASGSDTRPWLLIPGH